MRRFAPALWLVALIVVGVVAVWATPWKPHGWTAGWVVLSLAAASKLIAIGLAIHRSWAGA